MDAQILRPRKERIEIKGRISYSQGDQAWNTVRFKKQLIAEFLQLKEKQSKFGYKMIFYQGYDQFEKFIRKLKKEGEAVPILMWLVKEKNN